MSAAIKIEEDLKAVLTTAVGAIEDIEVFNNQVLVAVYIRPEKTKGGIIRVAQTLAEDKIQGKVGLVIKKGPIAFLEDGGLWFQGVTINLGDWVYFRPSDGWALTINGAICRILEDVNVKGRVQHPDQVY